MVDYVEFPFDLVREVVVPKKKDDGDGTIDPGDPENFPCGAFNWIGDAPYLPGIYGLRGISPWVLKKGTDGDGGVRLVWQQVFLWTTYRPDIDPVPEHQFITPWIYGAPNQVLVQASTIGLYDVIVVIPFEIQVWRNRDPRSFNPCTMPPEQSIDGGYGGPEYQYLTVDVQTSNEEFAPLFMVNSPGTCTSIGVRVGVQGICKNQTNDALPPQPNGWPVYDRFLLQDAGEMLPGSIFETYTGI